MKSNEDFAQQSSELRKRTEENLHQVKNLLSSIFNALQDLVIVIDNDFRVMMSNWKDHEFISVKERQGNPYCYAAFMGRKTPCEHCHTMEMFATGEIKAFEHTNPIDGQTHEIQMVPIFDDQKNVVMVIEHFRNITDKKRAEEALRENEEKYRMVIENANEGILVAQDGMLQFVNPALTRISGYSKEELSSKPFSEFVHPDDKGTVMEHHWKRLSGDEEPEAYHLRMVDKGGDTRWLRNNGVIINWEGKPATLNFISDITAQKQVEDARRESEEMFRSLFSASPIGIEVYGSEGQLLNVNRSCLDILGISDKSQIIDFNLFEDPNVPDEVKEKLRRSEPVGYEAPYDFEKVKKLNLYETTKSGSIYLDMRITPFDRKEGKSVSGYLVQIQDITDRKRADEQIHTLTQELLKAQENERQMISRELHDRLAQDLSVSKIELDMLLGEQFGLHPESKQKAIRISNNLQRAIKAVRDLSYDLLPLSLNQFGLVKTISEYCEDFSLRTGLNIDFSSAGMTELELDFDTEINLYRLVQEGLNNIKKHADATEITIRLAAAYPNIILRIIDNGKGFDLEERLKTLNYGKRMGLRSMEERVNLLKGDFIIQSKAMEGTRITIKIPYAEQKSGTEENHIDR